MKNFSFLDWNEDEEDRKALLTMIEINEYIKENIIIEEDLLTKLNINVNELNNLKKGQEKVNINTLIKIENYYNRKFFMIINENLRNFNLNSFDKLLNLSNSNLKKIGESQFEPTTKNTLIFEKKKNKYPIKIYNNVEFRMY